MAKVKSRWRVVILSDKLQQQRGARKLLENRGFETAGASTTEDAELLIRAWNPDLLVVDDGIAPPLNSPTVVSMGLSARAMLNDVAAVVIGFETISSQSSGRRGRTFSFPDAQGVDEREERLHAIIALADEAVRRDLILGVKLIAGSFRITTLKASYSLPPEAARSFLKEVLNQAGRMSGAA